MCPVDYGYNVAISRPTRFIILLTIIIKTVILWAGAGTAVVLAAYNTGRILVKTWIAEAQADQMSYMEKGMNNTDHGVRKLQVDFNSLLSKLDKLEGDYLELKGNHIGTNFVVISYITSRIVIAKQAIQNVTRPGRMNICILDLWTS